MALFREKYIYPAPVCNSHVYLCGHLQNLFFITLVRRGFLSDRQPFRSFLASGRSFWRKFQNLRRLSSFNTLFPIFHTHVPHCSIGTRSCDPFPFTFLDLVSFQFIIFVHFNFYSIGHLLWNLCNGCFLSLEILSAFAMFFIALNFFGEV